MKPFTACKIINGYMFGVGIYWQSWTVGIEFDACGFNLCAGPLQMSARRLTYDFVMDAIGYGEDSRE